MIGYFKNNILKSKKNHLVFILFGALIAIFYGNTLLNGFVLDDNAVIVWNPFIQSLKYLPKVITGCIWEPTLGTCKGTTLHYRPFHNLSYLITYQISSSAWIFHLVNLIYLFFAVFAVFKLAEILTKNFTISVLAGLFFLIHPINSEPVNWVSSIPDLLVAGFISFTLFFYAKYRKTGTKKNLFLAGLFFLFSVFSKETAVFVLPPLILLSDLILFKKKPGDIFSSKSLKEYLFFVVPFFIYFLMRAAAIGGFGGLSLSSSYLGSFSLKERVYYFFWLFSFRFLGKLFYPYPLIFYHALKEKPDIFSLRFGLSLLIFFAFLAVFFWALKRKKNFLAFSVIWIFVSSLPFLVFERIAGENLYAERYLIVSSIGFSLALAFIFEKLFKKEGALRIFVSVALFLIFGLSFCVIFPRNKTWNSDISFLETNISLNPGASTLREYFAKVLRDRGEVEAAKAQWDEIIRFNPDWRFIALIYNNMGEYYREKNDLEKAREYYEKAIQSPYEKNYKSFNNMGKLLLNEEKYLEAILYFCRAFKINPAAPDPVNSLNYAASIIDSAEKEDFLRLYQDIVYGEIFKKSAEEKIVFKRKTCVYDNCIFFFSSVADQGEIILPFLIMAEALPNEVIKIEEPSYNPALNEIAIKLGLKYEERSLTFLFPTCNEIYYSVKAE